MREHSISCGLILIATHLSACNGSRGDDAADPAEDASSEQGNGGSLGNSSLGTSQTRARAAGGSSSDRTSVTGGARQGVTSSEAASAIRTTSAGSSASISTLRTTIARGGGTNSWESTRSTGGWSSLGGASTASGTSANAGASSRPPDDPAHPTEFAPYFYTWGWNNSAYPFSGLADLKAKTGLQSITLAFVLSNGQCAATTDIQDHLADLEAFRRLGGHVKASFGGANGTYLENACPDAESLAQAISDFVVTTNVTDLDFDVEQGVAMDASVNARRAQALKRVQTERNIDVSYTLAVTPRDKWETPGGLSASSLAVLAATLDAQVRITHVNVMAMDYGPYFSQGRSMGTLAISALTDTATQLKSLMLGASDVDIWRSLGVTPMIGQNDVASEVFSLADARSLWAFAREKQLGLVSFWAINRDQPCPYDDLAVCSKVNSEDFEFARIFGGVE